MDFDWRGVLGHIRFDGQEKKVRQASSYRNSVRNFNH
jgi:hypothetical protein